MFTKLRNFILGESLRTEELHSEKFNVFWGLPILSSDAISSVAYAGEEILWVFVPLLGLLSYKYMLYVSLCIVALLFIVVFSYKQTIDSYPHGGGSYIVAKENLGVVPGLVAASALSIDYVLTVSVSICAGTAAITSAIPALLGHKVAISLFILLFMSIGNLRGLKDASRVFGIPTYLFMLCMVALIMTGLVKYYFLGYQSQPIYQIPPASGEITLFLFLRAFASGCSALTGVEAVSDGIPNFKDPAQKNAKRVLFILAFVVLFIFGGTSYLATIYHAVPNDKVTVVSQIASQVFGSSFMYYAVQVTTALILIMAANTAFTDLPLLLSIIANDGFFPRQFSKRGKRLSFSNGIILLALIAAVLISFFGGDTHRLVPLYAVGVFISFTLSQSGMFVKWKREQKPGWQHKRWINGIGAFITFIIAIIIGVEKFAHGAWVVCLLIPLNVLFMTRIKKHYDKVAEQLRIDEDTAISQVDFKVENDTPTIILVDSLNKSFIKSLNCSRKLSNNIIALNVSTNPAATEKLKKKWKDYNMDVPLVVKESPYRYVVSPIVEFIEEKERGMKSGQHVTVVLSQITTCKWWHNFLHNQTGIFIKNSLYKHKDVVVVTVPYIIKRNA